MKIRFKTSRLQKQYEYSAEAERAYGPEVWRRYIQRIDIMRQCADLKELFEQTPLRCHPLTGDRKGQWAVSLTGKYRLIFIFDNDQFTIVQIQEVSMHYGG